MDALGYMICAMPSPRHRSPRLQLTLTPDVMAILAEISALTGQGKATLVADLMTEMLPFLHANLEALQVLKDAPREAQAILARKSNEAVMKLAQAQMDFDDALAKHPRVKRKKRKGMADGPP